MTKLHPLTEMYRPHKGVTRQIVEAGDRVCLVLDTPFNKPDVDGIPFDQVNHFKNLAESHAEIWPDIINGKIKLVLMFTDWWHTVNQDEAHMQKSGNLISLDLYDICYQMCKQNNILSNSVFISPSSLKGVVQYPDWPIVHYNEPFNRYFEYTDKVEVDYTKTYDKHFLWLNRRVREHRLYALHQASKMNLFNNCVYSLHDFNEYEWFDDELNKFLLEYISQEEIDLSFMNVNKVLDTDYDPVGDVQHIKEIRDLSVFSNQTYLHIVGEFNCSNEKVYVTEKASRPIVMGKPFVLFGDRYSLAELRDMGFKTFNNFWDESYDELPTAKQRIDGALDTLDWIRNNMDITKPYTDEMIKVLKYNRDYYNNEYRSKDLEVFRKAVA